MDDTVVPMYGPYAAVNPPPASLARQRKEIRDEARAQALLNNSSQLTRRDLEDASAGIHDLAMRMNPGIGRDWKANPPSFYGCTHNCAKGSLGITPGTSAYGKPMNRYYEGKDGAGREDYVQSCMPMYQGGMPCLDKDNAICKMKLYFCDNTCPFTRFEKQILTNDGNEIEVGNRNPVLLKNDKSMSEIEIVRADHGASTWHMFWSAVREFRNTGVVHMRSLSKECLSKMLYFNQYRNISAYHAMLNYQYDAARQTEVNCEVNDFIKMNMKLYGEAVRFLGTSCATGEANPWLCGRRYDDFSEMVCSRETKLYAAVYDVEETLRETVGDAIYRKFCRGFHVNNGKELQRIYPKGSRGKRKDPAAVPALQQYPMWNSLPIPVPGQPNPMLTMPPAPVPKAAPTFPPMPAVAPTPVQIFPPMPSAAGSSGQGVATPPNFWESRYPNPTPSVPAALQRKKQRPNVVYNPFSPAATDAASNSSANSHPGSLQYVPADNSASPPSSPQGVGFLMLLDVAQRMERTAAVPGPVSRPKEAERPAAKSHKKKPPAPDPVPTRESLERDRNGFILKMKLSEKMLAECNAKIEKLCLQIRQDKEFCASGGHGGEVQARRERIGQNTTELGELTLECSEKNKTNEELRKQFEGSEAWFRAKMAAFTC